MSVFTDDLRALADSDDWDFDTIAGAMHGAAGLLDRCEAALRAVVAVDGIDLPSDVAALVRDALGEKS